MSLVDPEQFISVMERRWTAEYGNVTSASLLAMWRCIVNAMNAQIATPRLPRPVLAAELGAGKTTAAKVFCAMLTDRASHPGVLIVTRTKAQADEYAREINAWSGAPAGGGSAVVENIRHQVEDLCGALGRPLRERVARASHPHRARRLERLAHQETTT